MVTRTGPSVGRGTSVTIGSSLGAGLRSRSAEALIRQWGVPRVPTIITAAATTCDATRLRLATTPHNALPRARPPTVTRLYRPIPRARTHPGSAACAATLIVVKERVHAAPPTNRPAATTHSL